MQMLGMSSRVLWLQLHITWKLVLQTKPFLYGHDFIIMNRLGVGTILGLGVGCLNF